MTIKQIIEDKKMNEILRNLMGLSASFGIVIGSAGIMYDGFQGYLEENNYKAREIGICSTYIGDKNNDGIADVKLYQSAARLPVRIELEPSTYDINWYAEN